MNLPAFCIRRPAFTIVISLVMVITGMIGFMNLPVRWIPNVSLPQITIETSYPGANARLVEHDVTKVIEDALSGINGIQTLTSISRQDRSRVMLTFQLGRNMNAATEDVRAAVDRVRDELPREVQNPTVVKADPDSNAFMFISFADSQRNSRELSDYVDKYILPSFETLDGVGRVDAYGKHVSAMQIKLDPIKMAAANVTVDEIAQLLQEQNASIPGGQIRGSDRFYSILLDTSLKTARQFNDLIIRDNQNQIVRLKDVGKAKIDIEDPDSTFRVNGKPGIALGIIPQSTANPLEVEKEVQKTFAELKRTLPVSMQANIIYNQADYIRASINSVYEAFIESIIFVWLVILIFLCHFRATLIPVITIPVCIVSSFALLYFLGFSINTITLMAFVLAIGLVVDDAIVMLENISRHKEAGMSPMQAALQGSREMIFPVIAMTLTLTAVYAPIAFTSGLLGVLFREFTFTLAGAVLISGIVALTLSPMMCSCLLRAETKENAYSKWLTPKLIQLQDRYAHLLTFLLEKRNWVMAGLGLIAGIGFAFYHFLPSELAPQEDMSEIDVHVSAPHSASYLYTDSYVKELEAMYASIPEITAYLTINYSASHAFQVLILKPRAERQRSADEIVAALDAQTKMLSGVRVNVFAPPPPLAEFTDSDSGNNLGIAIMTASDYRQLQMVSQQFMEAIRKVPGFLHVDNRLKWDTEQFQVNVDRDRAADLKVPLPAITNSIATLIAGMKVGKTDEENIFIKVNDAALADANIFQQLYVRNIDNKMIPLASLLNVQTVTAPEVFHRYGRMRADIISLSLAPDLKLSTAIDTLRMLAKKNLPENMKYTFVGEAKSFLDSNGKTIFTFLLALVFIYLILVAQFESFIDPLIIMLTVPFAIVGALITLKIFGGSLNIYSNIGLITLIGLIAKHGILITEFANRLREQGKSIQEAVMQASMLRLRPILMTTAAMVLGALPLAMATGAGAESRQQVGLVIVGGMLLGTFFSLIIVPIAYTYLAQFRKINLIAEQENEYATVL